MTFLQVKILNSSVFRYTQNGILHMLDRNKRIKPRPERFQNCKDVFDLILTCEERVYDQVVEGKELELINQVNFEWFFFFSPPPWSPSQIWKHLLSSPTTGTPVRTRACSYRFMHQRSDGWALVPKRCWQPHRVCVHSKGWIRKFIETPCLVWKCSWISKT